MAKRFFIRFNIQKCSVEAADEFANIKSYIDITDDEITGFLNEFDTIQKERSERVKKKCGDCIDKLYGKKVMFVGDSITSERLGYRTTVSMAAEIDALDCAISGATTSSIRDYARGKMNAFSPEIISIMLGSNDGISVEDREFHNVSLSEYKRNLEKIVSWSVETGATVMLIEVPHICQEKYDADHTNAQRYMSNATVDIYNEVVCELAEKYGTGLMKHNWMNTVENYPSLFEPDGLHLSLKGHELMAECYIKTLSAMI